MDPADEGAGNTPMVTSESITFELRGRLADLEVGKTHLSVRYEPGPRIVRVGAAIDTYTWDTRAAVLDRLLEFEDAHADEFAVDFDIIPLGPVSDPTHAEA